ncbi:MAG: hypothetical protein DWQ29_00760 [Planctomycetota bacterium]|nr:MAG: hypothetical protein DWQ29_00760 [Planctomycetota bacterium]
MIASRTTPLCLVVFLAATQSAPAGEILVRETHLCCGSCISAVEEALAGIDGVSDVGADQNTKIIRFSAENDEAATAAIESLAEAGFYGKATHGDEPLEFPDSGAKKDAKAETVVFEGVHLCCGACVTGAKKSLEDVAGVETIEIDRTERRIKLIGADITVTKAVAALNAGGFYAKVAE